MKKIFLMIAAFGVFSIQASDLKYNNMKTGNMIWEVPA